MVSILVVEDETQKRRKITQALLAVEGINEDDIEHAIDLNSARQFLSERSFDLLILDIALPSRVSNNIQKRGGLLLLREILTQGTMRRPGHIIGVTAYEDIYETVETQFVDESFLLLRYDQRQEKWESQLQARLRHIVAVETNNLAEPRSYSSFMVVICALEEPELHHVLDIEWDWEQPRLPRDDTPYYHGIVRAPKRDLDVYAASAPRMGMAYAGTLAMKAITTFRPRYLAMVGITAGVESAVNLGDLIVGDPIWDYGSGKWTGKDGDRRFEPAPYQLRLDSSLRNDLLRFASDRQALSDIRASWPAGKPPSELNLHLGPLASGAAVIADNETALRVATQHRKLLGLEMEGYAVHAAAAEAPSPRPKVFTMKSVVDFANPDKGDEYQEYGAYVSARALKHFTEHYLSNST